MDIHVLFSQLATSLLLPPGLNFVLLALGYFLLKGSKKLAYGVISFSILSLYLLSLDVISSKLNKSVGAEQALNLQKVNLLIKDDKRRAIVVLSGGRISQAEEYGGIDIVSGKTLQRIAYASWLHKKTELPILVSGGSVFDESTPEAVLMNQMMIAGFNIAPKWIESESKNTAQNAINSADILKTNQISEILLVTHANHMSRAKGMFEKQGMKVIEAPTILPKEESKWSDFLPSAKALYQSHQALHEKLGSFWYSLNY